MYVIVQLGSHQYKVSEGDIIDAEKIDAKEDKSITIDQVLLYAKGQTVKVGQPYLTDVKVTARVVGDKKDKKVVSFKYRKRKDTSWKKGHRQKKTTLSITKIDAKE